MKATISIVLICFAFQLSAQYRYVGRIFSQETRQPLQGISVSQVSGKLIAVSDSSGTFSFVSSDNPASIRFTGVGFTALETAVRYSADSLLILMEDSHQVLDEVVVSTGYEKIPRERSTGSFTIIDSETLNRTVSTGIIDRLEGVTNGLQFDRRDLDMRTPGNAAALRVRGLSTINSDMTPLIVVDNFPYEGNITQLNPNDVQEVTLLKDAAAASIWGARAANGVIIITTRKGNFRQPTTISINSNITLQEKPDLFYSKAFLDSEHFIQVEKSLFERGYYNSQINSATMAPLSPVIELLRQNRDGVLGDTDLQHQLQQLGRYDFRQQASKYLYRQALSQQYNASVSGGGEKHRYRVSAGYDRIVTEMTGNSYDRTTVTSEITLKPHNFYELNLGVNYSGSGRADNGIAVQSFTPLGKSSIYPYARLADEKGEALAIPQRHRLSYTSGALENGLLDWEYRPLDEISFGQNHSNSSDLRIFSSLRFVLIKDLALELKYQYQNSSDNNSNVMVKDSYYVRDLVNRFTQVDGSKIFPDGDILRESRADRKVQNGRFQLSYNPDLTGRNTVSLLTGAELRQNNLKSTGFSLYGYSDDVLTYNNLLDFTTSYNIRPRGTSRIPQVSFPLSDIMNRYVSYFGNASYGFDKRYILSGSVRWDASNLFGVRTNQKGVPLWSAGLRWILSNEPFYNVQQFPKLTVRMTYGYNGNVKTTASAFPIIRYTVSDLTGMPVAYVRNPGDPGLRWEKVGVFNAAVDFSSQNSFFSGSIEFYVKNSRDLLGLPILDPTLGYLPNDTQMQPWYNYASLITSGLDINIQSRNLKKKISWKTFYLFNIVNNKVTHYETIGARSATDYTYNSSTPPIVGKSLDAIYSLPWEGLDPNTGNPLVNQNGQLTQNYSAYLTSLGLDDLQYSGTSFPRFQGSIRNSFKYKSFDLSFNIVTKAGYVFRRTSIEYSRLFDSWVGHQDFLNRWQKPGDEQTTQIPSPPMANVANRDIIYTQSTELIEKGDHVRWQDINVAYTFPLSYSAGFGSISMFAAIHNLGLLWRANKYGLDPDYPTANFLPGKRYSLGIQLNF